MLSSLRADPLSAMGKWLRCGWAHESEENYWKRFSFSPAKHSDGIIKIVRLPLHVIMLLNLLREHFFSIFPLSNSSNERTLRLSLHASSNFAVFFSALTAPRQCDLSLFSLQMIHPNEMHSSKKGNRAEKRTKWGEERKRKSFSRSEAAAV